MNIISFDYRDKKVIFNYLEKDLICKNWVEFSKFYEKDILEFIKNLNLKGTYIDCGSHFGNHTIFFSLFTDADKIISIEGNPYNYAFLEKNIKLNYCKNVKLFNLLVGDKNDEFYQIGFPKSSLLGTNIKNTGRSHVLQTNKENNKYLFDKVFTNNSVTIDTLLEKNGINNVSFIKLDIERFEYFALLGAEKTIQFYKPILQLELHDDNPFYNKIIEFLQKHHYTQLIAFGKNKIYHHKI